MEEQKALDSTPRIRESADHQAVWYRLPHLAPDSQEERSDLVLAIDHVEDHLSRLKFLLFVKDIKDNWPKGVAALGIRYDTGVQGAPLWHIRCWFKTRRPSDAATIPGAKPAIPGLELRATPADFSRFITSHAVQDDPGFARLASLHLSKPPAPWDKAQFDGLALDVLEPAARANLLAARADQALPPAAPRQPVRF